MKYLLQGMETRETIDSLLAFTKITSGTKVDAIYWHLVNGAQLGRAAVAFGVSQSKLSEAIATLNEVAGKAEKFHELKVYHPEPEEGIESRIKLMQEEGASVHDIVTRIKQLTRTLESV